jgi:hypothetical protein
MLEELDLRSIADDRTRELVHRQRGCSGKRLGETMEEGDKRT